jgi:hypothetical protein
LIELLDPILDKVIKPHKEWILSGVALLVGLLLTLSLGLRVLPPVWSHAPSLAGCSPDGAVRYRRDEMAQRLA